MRFKRTTVLLFILCSATTGCFLPLIQNIYEWMNVKSWIRGSHVWSSLFGVCVCRSVTDRLTLSEITANTDPDPPRNSQSHHKISFFPFSLSPSLSLTNTQSFSLCSHPVRSLAFSLCLSHTHALSLSPSGLCSCDPVPLPLRHSQRCCQWARRSPDRDVRKQILPEEPSQTQSATMVISRSRPRQSSQSSHPGQAISANAVQFGHSWRPRHGQNQHGHHQDLITAKTHLAIQRLRSTQTRPHKPRHGQIITNRFSRSQTETHPLNISGGIWNHPRPLSVYSINSWSQRHQRTTRTSPNRPLMRTVTGSHSGLFLNKHQRLCH